MRTLNVFFKINAKPSAGPDMPRDTNTAGSFFSKLLQNLRSSRSNGASRSLLNKGAGQKPGLISLNIPTVKSKETPGNSPQTQGASAQKTVKKTAGQDKTLQTFNGEPLVQQLLSVVRKELARPATAQQTNITVDKDISLTLNRSNNRISLTIKTGDSQKLSALNKAVPHLKSALNEGAFSGKHIQVKTELRGAAVQATKVKQAVNTPSAPQEMPQQELSVKEHTHTAHKGSSGKSRFSAKAPAQPMLTEKPATAAEATLKNRSQTKQTVTPLSEGSGGTTERLSGSAPSAQQAPAVADVQRKTKTDTVGRHMAAAVKNNRKTAAKNKNISASGRSRPQTTEVPEAAAGKTRPPEKAAPPASNLPRAQEAENSAAEKFPDVRVPQTAQNTVQKQKTAAGKNRAASDRATEKGVRTMMKKAVWQQEPRTETQGNGRKLHGKAQKHPAAQEQETGKTAAKTETLSAAKKPAVQEEALKTAKTAAAGDKTRLHSEAPFQPQALTVDEPPVKVKGQQLTARLQQVIRQFEQLKADGKERTVFKLSSSPVGELEIHLKNHKSGRQISLFVESDSMKAEVQKMLPQIQQNLLAKGLSFSAVSVDVGSFGQAAEQSAHSAGRRQTMKNSKGKETRYETDSSPVRVRRYGYNTIEIVA